MSAHMRKHHTNLLRVTDERGHLYLLPKSVAEKYREPGESISADEFFAEYEREYTKPGLILRGIRIREGYSQEEFAKLINVSQANLSKMELGKRSIGKEMAKRIEIGRAHV